MPQYRVWNRLAPIAIALACALFGAQDASANARKCLFVSSYHQGYGWSDGIERGLRGVLEGQCEIQRFDMDTKRRKSEEEIQDSARRAKALIESWRPDIVITADDNAAKYLIVPYYKNHSLPFVFCAVNWTAEEYGFPYGNVTGMLEVAPVGPTLERALQVVRSLRRVFYIGADTLTESKNLKRYQDVTHSKGLQLDYALVGTTKAWLAAFRRAQNYDLVILGNNAGINDWDRDQVRAVVMHDSRKLSVTNASTMMPYAMLGLTKVAEEQGEWAAKAALQILDGMLPRDIPIVANNRREVWINPRLLAASKVTLTDELMKKAKKVADTDQPPSIAESR